MCTCDLTTDMFEVLPRVIVFCLVSVPSKFPICSRSLYGDASPIRSAQILRCTVHCNSACWSLCLRASTQPRFFPSPTCQQWWIVFPPQPLSICCGWRLESWPNVLRPGSISCWHLTANNESIWGLHLRPLSLPLLSLVFFSPFSFIYVHLAHCSPTSCVCLSVSRTLNCILGNGLVYLA